ncbi:alpha/beta hydrolase [Algoriphagus sp. H41]|uniref:Alpha/beta hydrolase n=1 Tax=Algoriphagus oliviformis TaxID=2811231 RepID=A0ABS3BY04_9BACT|nr:alpha/beta hydrolase [Algoriphagus oliviformis]MBN7809567.1 alpha/beta hydrolase [Algoriphagus oliviformis]
MKKYFDRYFLLLSAVVFFSCDEDQVSGVLPPAELLDEAYGSHAQQKMDIFLPGGRSQSDTPLLVYIHGGAWIDGDKSEVLQVKPFLESEFAGYALISLNYRLFDFTTGSNGIATQEQDIISAFDYIEAHLGEWNLSDDIVIAGASAGGHLALLHAYKNNSSDLKAAVAFFPPTDLTALYGNNTLTASTLSLLMGGSPESAASAYAALSPISHVDRLDVPTILFHGDQDAVVPISQSALLEAKLQSENVRHEFTTVPSQGHGFTADTYAQLLRQARVFIGEF